MSASLQMRLTGGSSNSDPDLALGGVSSSNQLSATALHNLFDQVSSAEALAGDTEYRALDIYNAGDATAASVEMYMSVETPSSKSSLDFGKVTSPLNDTESIADESTAPVGTGITFAHYTSGSKLSLPDIPAGQYCRIWFKRIIQAAAVNVASDLGTITVAYA